MAGASVKVGTSVEGDTIPACRLSHDQNRAPLRHGLHSSAGSLAPSKRADALRELLRRRRHFSQRFDFLAALAALPEKQKLLLDTRYASLTTQPRALRFIDRMVADSRAVALNHTAGLSVPQQLQMALFALNGLMDREHRYKDAAKQLIRKRYQTLYGNMGVKAAHQPDDVNYYSLIDLQEIGGSLYGPEFKAWFIKSNLGISFLFRLAKEAGVVLLPGKGFEVVDTAAPD